MSEDERRVQEGVYRCKTFKKSRERIEQSQCDSIKTIFTCQQLCILIHSDNDIHGKPVKVFPLIWFGYLR